ADGAGRARIGDAAPHDAGDRAPPLDRAARRSHRRPRGRRDRRDRHARRADRIRRPVFAAGRPAVRSLRPAPGLVLESPATDNPSMQVPSAPSSPGRPIRSQYEDFMRHVRDHGVLKQDRTGTGTTSVFGYQMRFDLREGFPLVTTKKVHLRSIILELLWFLRGDGNARW